MIDTIHLQNFKSFLDERFSFGALSVIMGPNASGKSNIRDAFRFMHGIGRDYSLAECLNGIYSKRHQAEWEGVRGGSKELQFKGKIPKGYKREHPELQGIPRDSPHTCSWFRDDTFQIMAHMIHLDCTSAPRLYGEAMYIRDGEHVYYTELSDTHALGRSAVYTSIDNKKIGVPNDRPTLGCVLKENIEDAELRAALERLRDHLLGIRFLDPIPDAMRHYVRPESAELGDHGENLSAAIHQLIAKDPNNKRVLLDWLSELTPTDVEDIDFYHTDLGEVLLKII